jgi:hypothetical protein
MGQGTHKKLRITHEFELYKFKLDKFDCTTFIFNKVLVSYIFLGDDTFFMV